MAIVCPFIAASPSFAGGGTTVLPQDAGTNAANSTLQLYGSKGGLQSNISAPMTSSSTQMNTVDGSSSFSAALNGPASNKFLQVIIQPGASGDLATVKIFQDLNASGTFGPPTTLGAPVSGVCANGFISCQPGTWNSCHPYKWGADSTGLISYSPVGITSLGGCYCINNSCAAGGQSLAFANSAIILNNLGGGIVGAIQNSVAGVMITNVSSDVVTITYYGQLTQQVNTAANQISSLQTTPSAAQAQAYYNNPGQLATDTNGIGPTQGNDPTSMYSQLTAVSNNRSSSTCSMTYTGALVDTQKSISNTGVTNSICTDNNSYIQIVSTDNINFTFEYAGTGSGGLGEIGKNCGGQGWVPLTTATLPTLTSTTQWKLTSAAFTANISGAGCTTSNNAMDAVIQGAGTVMQAGTICGAGGAQWPNVSWTSLIQYTLETYQESYQDGCTAYEPGGANANNCTLTSETTDNVVTVQNGSQTGLQPLATCQTWPSQVGPDVQKCKPWWNKTRTYSCTVPAYDFTNAKQRFNTINSSTSQSGTTVNYTDYSQNSATGQWGASSNSFTLNNGSLPTDCEQACEVKRLTTNTQAGTTGVISNNRIVGTGSQDTYFLTCSNGSCPTQAGDVVLQDCTCLNAFDQAASIVQTMRLAGSDNICSSGTPQPAGGTPPK
jgi:hypothetical protein